MKVLVYNARSYDKAFLDSANQEKHELDCTEVSLEERSAISAKGYPVLSYHIIQPLLRGR
ncbi:MAG: hypothetical protein R6V59_03285 [Dehalococcoidia bacterium]